QALEQMCATDDENRRLHHQVPNAGHPRQAAHRDCACHHLGGAEMNVTPEYDYTIKGYLLQLDSKDTVNLENILTLFITHPPAQVTTLIQVANEFLNKIQAKSRTRNTE